MFNLGSGFNHPDDVGKAVTYSAGYTLFVPRHFKYLYPKTGFIPSYVPNETVYDPPVVLVDENGAMSCATGGWVARPVSSGYVARSPQGQAVDSESFAVGNLARYVGDNASDPCIIPLMKGDAQIAPYYDHYYRGNYNDQHQNERKLLLQGTASNGSAGSITDSSKNWWNDFINGSFTQTASSTITAVVPYTPEVPGTPGTPEVDGTATIGSTDGPQDPQASTFNVYDTAGTLVLTGDFTFTGSTTSISGRFESWMVGYTIVFTFHGTMHTESGTATGGSATTMVDSSYDITQKPAACWWDPARFTYGPYVGFTLQLSHGGDSWRVPITNSSSGSGGITLTFPARDGLTVSSGFTWAIVEPAYEINKWQGRSLVLTNSFGSTWSTIITCSDDITLFFGEIFPVDTSDDDDGSDDVPAEGWSYQIIEPHTGGVYQWSDQTFSESNNDPTSIYYTGGSWVVPSGDDTVRVGVGNPVPFLKDQTCNLETIVVKYGPLMVDDLITLRLFQELFWTINALQHTPYPVAWRTRHDLETPEYNDHFVINHDFGWNPNNPDSPAHTLRDGIEQNYGSSDDGQVVYWGVPENGFYANHSENFFPTAYWLEDGGPNPAYSYLDEQ